MWNRNDNKFANAPTDRAQRTFENNIFVLFRLNFEELNTNVWNMDTRKKSKLLKRWWNVWWRRASNSLNTKQNERKKNWTCSRYWHARALSHIHSFHFGLPTENFFRVHIKIFLFFFANQRRNSLATSWMKRKRKKKLINFLVGWIFSASSIVYQLLLLYNL